MEKPSRVLIVGGTGYMGKRLVMASLALGHPTFVLVRTNHVASNIHKAQLVISFKRAGAHLIQGSVDDHESIVKALKQVDVVISTIAESHIVEQLKLIQAIKEVGTIKRFLPSEFGMDADRMHHVMEPGNLLFEQKRQVRRATEAARIPYTYVSANCFAGYFLAGLAQYGRFIPPTDKVFIYGEGNRKVDVTITVIWVYEDDAAIYALKTVDDPKTVNKTVYIRPPKNILSQREVVEIWEKLCGKVLNKMPISEEDWLAPMEDESMSVQRKVEMAIFYHIFYRGELANFDLNQSNQLEASTLYPDVEYTSVECYLSRFA